MSPAAEALRANLLLNADIKRASEVANEIIQQTLDSFNEANTSVGTSLLARALLCHAMVDVAASWWADLKKAPLPETFEAMRDLVENMPPVLTPITWSEKE